MDEPRGYVASIVGGACGFVAAILLGVTIFLLGNGPLALDVWWHDLMLSWRTDAGLVVARTLQTVGGVGVMTVAAVLIVVGLLIARRLRPAITVAAAVILAELSSTVLKGIIARPRPDDSLSTVAATSYPSGHTTMAAVLTIVLALLLRRVYVWVIAILWILAMAWSRTYLEAHWLSDVIGGAVLGASSAVLAWATLQITPIMKERRPVDP